MAKKGGMEKDREKIWFIRLLNLSLTIILGLIFIFNFFKYMDITEKIIITITIITFSLITILLFIQHSIEKVEGLFLMGIFCATGFIFIFGVLFNNGTIKYFIISIGVLFILMALSLFYKIFIKKENKS